MTQAKRTRKSDRTRATIVEAAQEAFATLGFERATVRDIAARAAIDPAMIIRYFGSKDALFAQVAEFDLNLPDLCAIDSNQIGETLVRHFLSLWEGDAKSGLDVLLRSAASNEYAAEKLREIFASQVVPALPRTGDPAVAAQRAGLVASQLLGLALCRYVLKLPPVVAMPPEILVREVGAALQRHVLGG